MKYLHLYAHIESSTTLCGLPTTLFEANSSVIREPEVPRIHVSYHTSPFFHGNMDDDMYKALDLDHNYRPCPRCVELAPMVTLAETAL